MRELIFSIKNCKDTFGLSDSTYDFALKKPMLCPYCSAYQDGTVMSSLLFHAGGDKRFGTVSYACTNCQKIYLVNYHIDLSSKVATFGAYYPQIAPSYENQIIETCSPRFVDAINQALRAEAAGDIELSAIGYRQALECLVKDFAIVELGDAREAVAKKSLCQAIADYLGENDLLATADVVRILGNDYAHYERKYPEHDFELLKRYMEIFIKLVETKILIAHPPVSR